MHPVLFKIGFFTIHSYGVMLALGFLAATLLASREAQRRSMNKDLITDLAFVLIISGLIGARILYTLLNFPYFLKNPLEIFLLNRGGLVWYGGLIAAIISLIIFCKVKKQNILSMLDLFAPYAALGQAFGRIGCFLRGCCYGKFTDGAWGFYFPEHSATLYPTQLFSALALVVIFILLRLLSDRIKFRGGIFFSYLMLYSVFRFFIEFLRGDTPVIAFGLTTFQLMSIPILIISLILFLNVKSRSEKI